jgi:transposase InsO family protein
MGQQQTQQATTTRTGRISKPPRQDPAFVYSPTRLHQAAAHTTASSRPNAAIQHASNDSPDPVTAQNPDRPANADTVVCDNYDQAPGFLIDLSSSQSNVQSTQAPVLDQPTGMLNDPSTATTQVNLPTQTPVTRTRRKAVVISHLQRRAPLAVPLAPLLSDSFFLASEQQADPDISRFLAIFTDEAQKDSWDNVKHLSATVRALWQQRASLFLHNNVLYRRFELLNGLQPYSQLILPLSLRMAYLQLVHADSASHLTFDKCCPIIQQQAWWLTWRRDLKWFILCCQRCQAYSEGQPPHQVYLTPLIHGEPRQSWSIDLTGPHVQAGVQRFKYILTCIDCFSRFAVVVPLADKEGPTMARALIKHLFLVHGFADLQSDRGSEFNNTHLDSLVELTGIQKFKTTAYKPSTNGKAERYHRTFNAMLAKVINDNQRDWPDHILYVTFSYNACAHSSTGLSPFFLMFGQQPKWYVEYLLSQPDLNSNYDSLSEFATNLVDKLEYAYHTFRQQLQISADRNRDWYNKRVKPKDFYEGQRVRVFVPKRIKGRSPKLQSFI